MIGCPKLGNVAIRSASEKVNVLDIGTMMEQKGWFLGSGAKAGVRFLNCTIHETNHNLMGEMISELKECVDQCVKGNVPKPSGSFKVYGEIKGVPSMVVEKIITDCIQGSYEIENLKGVNVVKKE